MALTRDKEFIQSQLVVKDGVVFTKVPTIIEFPKWYTDKEMCVIEESSFVYGIFAIIIGDKYSVSVIPTLLKTNPVMIKEIERDGKTYVQFMYGKNDCLIADNMAVKHELLSYNLVENFFIRPYIPWYVGYEDVLRIMDNLPGYAGSSVGANWIANELIPSFIARQKDNKALYYRTNMKNGYEFIDFMNPYYSVTSNTLRLGGNYYSNALVSAITQPNTKATKLERLTR